jgi:phosphoserine / homoserine phosphotransferase
VDIVCLDLEGVLIPEMWIMVADATATDELRLTTRDISDYDELMRHRIDVLDRRGITLADIRPAIADVQPLPGAADFLDELRRRVQVAILSDTFVQFVGGVMDRLGRPFLLCNELVTDERDRVVDYRMRQPDGKRRAVEAFRELNLRVQAVGDSFNDIGMIRAADRGYLFRPSDTVVAAHPDLSIARTHEGLLEIITSDRRATA